MLFVSFVLFSLLSRSIFLMLKPHPLQGVFFNWRSICGEVSLFLFFWQYLYYAYILEQLLADLKLANISFSKLKILLHYLLVSIVAFVKITVRLLLILVSFLSLDSLMIFKVYYCLWGSAISLWNILVWVSFYLSHLLPSEKLCIVSVRQQQIPVWDWLSHVHGSGFLDSSRW